MTTDLLDRWLGINLTKKDKKMTALFSKYESVCVRALSNILENYKNSLYRAGIPKQYAVLLLAIYDKPNTFYFKNSKITYVLAKRFIRLVFGYNLLSGKDKKLIPLDEKQTDDFYWVTFKFFQDLKQQLKNPMQNVFRIKFDSLCASEDLDPSEVIDYYDQVGGGISIPKNTYLFLILAGYLNI